MQQLPSLPSVPGTATVVNSGMCAVCQVHAMGTCEKGLLLSSWAVCIAVMTFFAFFNLCWWREATNTLLLLPSSSRSCVCNWCMCGVRAKCAPQNAHKADMPSCYCVVQLACA